MGFAGLLLVIFALSLFLFAKRYERSPLRFIFVVLIYLGFSVNAYALTTPTLTAPSTGITEYVGTTLNFTWSAVSGATGYELEFDAGQSYAYTATATTASLSWPIVAGGLGSHTWQVRAKSGTTYSAWSSPRTYTVAFSPITLVSPANSATVYAGSTVIFSWTAPSGATAYDVEFDTGTSYAFTTSTTAASLSWLISTSTGSHTWHVRAKAGTSVGDWTATQTYTSAYFTPSATAPTNGTTEYVGNSFNFSWTSVTGVTGYDFEYDPGTSYASTVTTTTNSLSSTPAAQGVGSHTWHVRSKFGTIAGPWSTTSNYNIAYGVPTLTAPANSSTQYVGSTANFTWTAIPGADGYDIEFDAGTGYQSLTSSTTNSLSWPIAATGIGPHTWQVRARYGSANGTWTTAWNYMVAFGIPTLSSPASGAAAYVGDNINFAWSAVSGATSYDIEFDAGTTYQTISTSNANSLTAAAVVGGLGPHTWQVRAKSGTIAGPWSAASNYTVSLYVPVLSSPAPAYTAYVGSTINFAWSAVTGATVYEIEFDAGTSYQSSTTSPNNSLSWPIVTAGVGSHTWQVRAKYNNITGPWSSYQTYTVVNTTNSGTTQTGPVLKGYFPDYRNTAQATAVQYSLLTDIFYSLTFSNTYTNYVGPTGNILMTDYSVFNIVKSNCTSHNVNLYLSISDDASTYFPAIAENATSRQNFAAQCADFCANNGLKGIDIDWESSSSSDGTYFNDLLSDLRTALTNKTKVTGKSYLISIAAPKYNSSSAIGINAFQYIDCLNVMAYDDALTPLNNYNHSTISFMEDLMTSWANIGVPYSKIVVGVPFYGRKLNLLGPNPADSFADISIGDPATAFSTDNFNTWSYNGQPTIASKIAYILGKGAPGAFAWELTQDRTDQYSLLAAMKKAEGSGAATCTAPPAPSANFGADACAAPSSLTGTTASLAFTSNGGNSFQAAVSKYPYGSGNIISSIPCQTTTAPFQVTGLAPGMIYRWNMYAYGGTDCSSCQSPVSNTKYFSIPPVISSTATQLTTAGTITLSTSVQTPGSGGSISYRWLKDGQPFLQGSNLSSVSASAPGTYTLINDYTGSTDCGGTTSSAASNAIIITASTGSGCTASTAATGITQTVTGNTASGPTIQLTQTGGSLGSNASWHWYRSSCGGTPVGTGASITINPTVTDDYFVRAEGDCGNTACFKTTVSLTTGCTYSTDPTALTPSADNTLPGTTVTLTVSGGVLAPNASWYLCANSCGGTPAGSGRGVAFNVTPTVTTTYYIQAVGGCNTTNCTSVTVHVLGSFNFAPIPAQTYGAVDLTPAVTGTGPFTFSSNNTAVATIVTGKIHIIGAGTTTISATDGNSTQTQQLIVNPAPLTIKANDQTRPYGSANPALTVSYSGFVNGETNNNLITTPTVQTAAGISSPAGTYPITASGAVAANYIMTYVAGTLTVSPVLPPTLTTMSTTSAPSGTPVTLTGTNLGGATATSFGGTAAASFTINSATSITAVVGGGTSGNVSVTTPGGTATLSGFTYIFSLPVNNFTVAMTSASCRGSSNGSIGITAVQSLSYTATISGSTTSYPFSSSTTIPNLAAGTYTVCIMVAGQSFQQCYTVVISEPKDLALYVASINPAARTVDLLLTGGDTYHISLNGGTAISTSQSNVTLNLQAGSNHIVLTSDKPCQVPRDTLINLSANPIPYPVPFEGPLNVNLGPDIIKLTTITIYSVANGAKVFSGSYSNRSGVLTLDLGTLRTGVYELWLTRDQQTTNAKITKQ
jgi:hypothetical protein